MKNVCVLLFFVGVVLLFKIESALSDSLVELRRIDADLRISQRYNEEFIYPKLENIDGNVDLLNDIENYFDK